MKFLYPVPSTSIVTQSFAEHVHRAKINNWQNYNGGIDWAIPSGSPIVAAQAGKVVMLRNDATGYGTHVRIQHEDGFLSIYAHMMDFAVRVGDEVRAGEVIGRSDNTGNSTGPHLHFELRRNNKAVDPSAMLVTFLTPDGPPGPGPGPVEPVEPDGGNGSGEIPVGEEPEAFPALPLARVISTIGLNVRMGPGVGNPTVGFLPPGTQVEVLRKAPDGDDAWLQIGFQQFIAMKVAGETYTVWQPAAPQPAGQVRKRKSRKKKAPSP
jgi:murein DD-endopeptidase MepM/ murein hydrolase activator NlpD